MTDLEKELLDLVCEQHRALDTLLAMLIERDDAFMPTQSGVWPIMVKGAAMMERMNRPL